MSKEDRDNILAARAADAMARVASVAKGKNMSEWEDESGSRISQTTARKLLAAENHGTEVIVRDSDGAVFVRQDVAERVITRFWDANLLLKNERSRLLEAIGRASTFLTESLYS